MYAASDGKVGLGLNKADYDNAEDVVTWQQLVVCCTWHFKGKIHGYKKQAHRIFNKSETSGLSTLPLMTNLLCQKWSHKME